MCRGARLPALAHAHTPVALPHPNWFLGLPRSSNALLGMSGVQVLADGFQVVALGCVWLQVGWEVGVQAGVGGRWGRQGPMSP